MEFKILKKSKKSKARLGLIKTTHGIIETPALVPVATQATIKTLESHEAVEAGCQMLIANTFHLHLKPGEKIVKANGGLHNFMKWPRPLMTDSGGFQVFSLGFGYDLGVGKVLKFFPGNRQKTKVEEGAKPTKVKITEAGVYFQSPIDGRKLFIGPKESIKIQEQLGADIIFSFDECTPPLSTKEYAERALQRTHNWAKICIKTKKRTKQALFGIVQGSRYKDLRIKSARFISSLGFDGYGIGGDMGDDKVTMEKILSWVMPELTEDKPKHMLGIGYLEDMEKIVKLGIDTFDCTVPTHYGRRGIAFTSHGKLNLKQSAYLRDKKPLDKKCPCRICRTYSRSYICHLLKANEITGMELLTFHNLAYFNDYIARIREKIRKDLL